MGRIEKGSSFLRLAQKSLESCRE